MIKVLLTGLFLAITIPDCGTTQEVLKPHPTIPTDTESCKAGCDHLMTLKDTRDSKMGCEEARPLQLPDGGTQSCEAYCIERQNAGRSLHPSCWVNLTSCSDIDSVCRWK